MTARSHPIHPADSTHGRVLSALLATVARIGVVETGRAIGLDDANVTRRMKAASAYAWPLGDVLTLKKRERDEFGTRELHDAETIALYSAAHPTTMLVSTSAAQAASRASHFVSMVCNHLVGHHQLSEAEMAELEPELAALENAVDGLRALIRQRRKG